MKHSYIPALIIIFLCCACFATITACNDGNSKPKETSITDVRNMETEEMVANGHYLVDYGGCNHCHSPKIMGPNGPINDTSVLLSGYPQTTKMQPFTASALTPGSYVLGTPDLTAWIGPWGISYAANLTPDSTLGMGSWDEDTFVKTMRTGKHLGQPDGRQILPPMPWYDIGKLTDNDLKSIYAYLRSIPPIKNKVPAPVPPAEALAMANR